MAFRVKVDPDGKPNACEIIGSSGAPVLDEATCFLVMARAKFYPARDAKGQATEGVYSNAIRWILPPNVSKTLSPKSETLTFILDKDGSIKDCRFVVTGANAEETMKGKNLCNSHAAFNEPYRNADGKAVTKRVTMKSSLELEDVEE
ncbi:TonB-like protein [Novosphingobium taihuense]|nr:TonB-like protein [Novosphingobium taihuense]